MFSNGVIGNYLRKKVAGKHKIRLEEEGFNLDMTYITPRIIAMSFPASVKSGFQFLYRNRVDHVSQILRMKHGNNYFVYNLSE